jgi:hypothetical protein
MDPLAGGTIATHFATLPDPRIDRAKRHELLDIVTIAQRAVTCGADSSVEVERFGRAKQGWLQTRMPLPHGFPSHDTFGGCSPPSTRPRLRRRFSAGCRRW